MHDQSDHHTTCRSRYLLHYSCDPTVTELGFIFGDREIVVPDTLYIPHGYVGIYCVYIQCTVYTVYIYTVYNFLGVIGEVIGFTSGFQVVNNKDRRQLMVVRDTLLGHCRPPH